MDGYFGSVLRISRKKKRADEQYGKKMFWHNMDVVEVIYKHFIKLIEFVWFLIQNYYWIL